MGSSDQASTAAERFAAWLADAMREAGYNIDDQRGGGRIALAADVGVGRSTITRWLDGQGLPSAEQFAPLAAALKVSVVDMLIGSGIIPPESAQPPEKRARLIMPDEVIKSWGITDPQADAMLRGIFKALIRPRIGRSKKSTD